MLTTEATRTGRLSSVVDVADRLRQAQGLNHDAIVGGNNRPKSGWDNMRAGRRPASPSFVRALQQYAEALGGGWPERIEAAAIEDALARYTR